MNKSNLQKVTNIIDRYNVLPINAIDFRDIEQLKKILQDEIQSGSDVDDINHRIVSLKNKWSQYSYSLDNLLEFIDEEIDKQSKLQSIQGKYDMFDEIEMWFMHGPSPSFLTINMQQEVTHIKFIHDDYSIIVQANLKCVKSGKAEFRTTAMLPIDTFNTHYFIGGVEPDTLLKAADNGVKFVYGSSANENMLNDNRQINSWVFDEIKKILYRKIDSISS